jgi:hypothetical protein
MKFLKPLLTILLLAIILPVLNGQKLDKDVMVLNWNFSPLEGISAVTLEDFIQEEYLPALKKNFEGASFYFLRSDRGANEGKYSILVVLESIDARNEWWPEKGVSSEKAKKMLEKTKDSSDKFYSLAKLDSWNDWLILK